MASTIEEMMLNTTIAMKINTTMQPMELLRRRWAGASGRCGSTGARCWAGDNGWGVGYLAVVGRPDVVVGAGIGRLGSEGAGCAGGCCAGKPDGGVRRSAG